ncbi:uncharacterized protein LOC110834443 isoform X3 [Zootermopsis nevadensis]|uniref:uncharacterized protein LOC110834443 isoform X3 n=1 Tax=Zootermopsis nevadensis TaxID=136037 RepID=UPI000B8E27EB|nr:uncharacterized protein LOC110834443 isoform X3 [Zootermopsis nevadensis]
MILCQRNGLMRIVEAACSAENIFRASYQRMREIDYVYRDVNDSSYMLRSVLSNLLAFYLKVLGCVKTNSVARDTRSRWSSRSGTRIADHCVTGLLSLNPAQSCAFLASMYPSPLATCELHVAVILENLTVTHLALTSHPTRTWNMTHGDRCHCKRSSELYTQLCVSSS